MKESAQSRLRLDDVAEHDLIKDFTCVGKVYSGRSGEVGKELKILRDTGARMSLMVRYEDICTTSEILPERRVIYVKDRAKSNVPLCKIRLEMSNPVWRSNSGYVRKPGCFRNSIYSGKRYI